MSILVMNRITAPAFCQRKNDRTSVLISIFDKNGIPAENFTSKENNIKDILWIQFNDVEEEDNEHELEMTNQDAEMIAHFFNKWKNKVDDIIVQCDGGVSRSAGVAAALQRLETNQPSIFFNGTKCPNSLCYFLMLKALNINFDKNEENKLFEENIRLWRKINLDE